MNIIRFYRLFHRTHRRGDDHRRMSLMDHIHINPNDEQDRRFSDRLRFYARKIKRKIISWMMKRKHTAIA